MFEMWEVRESAEYGDKPSHYAYFVNRADAEIIQEEDPSYRYANPITLYESVAEFQEIRDNEALARAQKKARELFTADERRILGINAG